MRSVVFAALAALCLSGAAATASPSDAGRIEFEVLRNGHPFGRHTVVVSGTEGNLRATSSVTMRANMGPVTVFRLEQNCSETWTEGVLTSLACNTLKDGRRTHVQAERRDGRLHVRGAEGENWFPLSAFPASWWTKPPAGVVLINTETGEPMRATISHLGRETIEIGGRRIAADRVRVTGTLTGDLWYDSEGRWVGCNFRARGQEIEYRLATSRANAPA